MSVNRTVLCIHPNAAQLRRSRSFLRNSGYRVLAAASGRGGLRVLARRAIDAVVLDDGAVRDELSVASLIKDLKPRLPIIMMADHIKLPASALSAVDAMVAKADPPEFLLATLHFVLNTKLEEGTKRRSADRKTARRARA